MIDSGYRAQGIKEICFEKVARWFGEFHHPQNDKAIALTKREFFAGCALIGELSCQSQETGVQRMNAEDTVFLAKRCVAFAEALMKRLEDSDA